MKKVKLALIAFIIIPAIFMSFLLYFNKDNIGFSRHHVVETTFTLDGMTCISCVKTVTDKLEDLNM